MWNCVQYETVRVLFGNGNLRINYNLNYFHPFCDDISRKS